MIAHIDMSMELLKKKQYKLCSIEKYLELEKYYLYEKTFEEIAEELNCGIITTRRWVNEMVNELGIFLFGVDEIFLIQTRL